MNFLIDTCVLSEFVKKKPAQKIVDWLKDQEEESLFLSVMTIGEIQKGVVRLPESKKKKDLQIWLNRDLKRRFEGRILPVDDRVATLWGEILGHAEIKGDAVPAVDGLIAATGLAHDLVVITRNAKHIAKTGVRLVDPWL